MEAVQTKVDGAKTDIRAATENQVSKVIVLSTDEAANPINLYGATKLASDKTLIAANNIAGGHKTCFSVMRYGNVIGSRGSVVSFLKRFIEEGAEEVPITDKRMTRFRIISAEEVDFVLNDFQRMQGGEHLFRPALYLVVSLSIRRHRLAMRETLRYVRTICMRRRNSL